MCRVLGSVASEPVSLRRELLEADSPLVRPKATATRAGEWPRTAAPRARSRTASASRTAPAPSSRTSPTRGPPAQRPRAPRDHRRRHAREHPPVLPRAVLVQPQRHDPQHQPADRPEHRSRRRRHGLGAPVPARDAPPRLERPDRRPPLRRAGDHRAVPVLEPQLPVQRRRAPVRLSPRPLRAALALAARPAAGGVRARDRGRDVALGQAGRPARARPARPRRAPRRAARRRRRAGSSRHPRSPQPRRSEPPTRPAGEPGRRGGQGPSRGRARARASSSGSARSSA